MTPRINKRLARWLRKLATRLDKRQTVDKPVTVLQPVEQEMPPLLFSSCAIQKLFSDFDFDTVLDIGCGEGQHSEIFLAHGKSVTAIDYGESVYFEKNRQNKDIKIIVADFGTHDFGEQFDSVFCSHVLEHQLNVHEFLTKVHGVLKEDGVLAITVPPLKHEIVGGHVSFWNAGLLLYRLVLAGFNCRGAAVLCYGYNISVVVKKQSVTSLPDLAFDAGDIRKIKQYLPVDLQFTSNEIDDPFHGNIKELNWL